ncbi:MAG: hypothetical protein AAGF87_16630 [Bacteroidota bacterium]
MQGAPAIISLYHPEQGYGYVQLKDTHETFRFRFKDWLGMGLPQVGQLVEFRLQVGKQGYLAVEVKPMDIA